MEPQMALADMIPTLDDSALASLRDNARRLEAKAGGRQQQQAAEALPLIEAELAARLARKPKKTPAKRAPKAKKVVEAAETAETAEAEETVDAG
jgi:hypothetical protein